MGNVTLLDDNKALVASGRERDAIIHRRCHLIEYPGCRIVKMTSVDNEIGLALAEALRDNTSLQTFSLASPTYTAGVGQSVDPFNCGILLNGPQWLLSKSQSWRGLPPSPPTRPRNRVVPVCPHRGTRTSFSATKLRSMLLSTARRCFMLETSKTAFQS